MKIRRGTLLLVFLLLLCVALPTLAQGKRKRKDGWAPFAKRLSVHGVWKGYLTAPPEKSMVEGLCAPVAREGSVAVGSACTTDPRDARVLQEAGALLSLSLYPVEVEFAFEPYGWGRQSEAIGADVRKRLRRLVRKLEGDPETADTVRALAVEIEDAVHPAVLMVKPGSLQVTQKVD